MKNKTILFGSLLAVFLMLMIPNISAIEYNAVESTIEEKINELCRINPLSLLQNFERKLTKISVNSIVYYITILLLYSLSLILSIFLGILGSSIDTGNPSIDALIMSYMMFIPPWLVLMLSIKIAKNEIQDDISTIIYILVLMISAFIVTSIISDDDEKKGTSQYTPILNQIRTDKKSNEAAIIN
jgi:hypothetical protein